MKQTYSNEQRKAGWHRLIALFLAVSMLIIPIQFPGKATAAEEAGTVLPNIVTDNFADTRYADGLTYRWNFVDKAFAHYSVADGCLTTGNPKSSGAYNTRTVLTAVAPDPSDPAKTVDYATQWTDYTAEVKFSKLPVGTAVGEYTTTVLSTAMLLVRVQPTGTGDYNYYYLQITGSKADAVNGSLSLWRKSASGTANILPIGSFPMAPGTWHTMKVQAEGNTLTVWYDGKEVGSVTDTSDEALLSGSVGLNSQERSGLLCFDDVTVTHADKETVFYDDFSDDRYVQGVTYQWNTPAEEKWDVSYKWEEKLTVNSTGTIETEAVGETSNDYYHMFPNRTSYVYLTAQADNPNDTSVADGFANWTDYTLEADFRRNEDTAGRGGVFLMGRVRYDTVNRNYCFYSLKAQGTAVYLLKQYYDTTKQAWQTNTHYGFAWARIAAETWVHAALTFKGNKISVTLTWDDNGTPQSATHEIVDDGVKYQYGPALTSGGVGFGCEYNDANTTCDIDNIKVTVGDEVVFEEDFTLTTELTDKDAYIAAGKTVENGFTPTSWSVSDGVYAAISAVPSVSLFSAKNGEKDYAKDWANYAIDADVQLGSAASTAGFVAHSDGTNYYELRLAAAGVSLYKVTGQTEEVLDMQAMSLSPEEWYFTKLEVEPDSEANTLTLKGYINSALVVEYTLNATEAYTKGTFGLKASGIAQFDNFAAYAVELSDSRQFSTYTFNVADVAALSPDWEIGAVGTWMIVDKKLTYENSDASVVGLSALKVKCTLDNYIAEASVTTPASGEVGIVGRYNANSYYKLALDQEDGLILSKTVAGQETLLQSVSVEKLYLSGLLVQPNTGYVLSLSMYQGLLYGSINGVRMICFTDEDPLISGVTGVAGNNGAAIVSVTTSEAFAPAALSLVDDKGNAVGTAENPIVVPQGKIPNLIYLFVKVDDGISDSVLVPVDTLQVSELDGTTVADGKTAEILYDGRSITMYYNVIDRTNTTIQTVHDGIAALAQMNFESLSENDVTAIEALAEMYDDLSYMEKEKITPEEKKSLRDAEEAILFLKHPELKDTDVVFTDDYDTVDSNDKYDNDYAVTGRDKMGNWFSLNGEMYEYDTHTVRLPEYYNTANRLVKRDFSVTSISVDVQLIEDKAWAGVEFHGYNRESYRFVITDKSNRIRLCKGNLFPVTVFANDVDPEFDFEKGEWYNLRVIFENGLIKCYVDDVLWISHQDVPTVTNDEILTHGTVSLYASENWVKFDNLEVRGVENEWVDEVIVSTNTDLEPGEYTDTFDDEDEKAKLTDEDADNSPSHWLEPNPENKWQLKADEQDADNLIYGSTGHTGDKSMSWLHVFETDVDISAKLRVTQKDAYAIMGLVARVNARNSYIKAGYDFTLQKWFIKVRYGEDFEEVATYAANKATVDVGQWCNARLYVKGTTIELYVENQLVVSADAGKKVSPGRIGVYTEYCDLDVDDFDAKLLSGQGTVMDGVLHYYSSDVMSGFTGNLFQVMELGDGKHLMHINSTQYLSEDGGKTWVAYTEIKNAGFGGGSTLVLHDGTYLNVKNNSIVKKSMDGGYTWTQVGTINSAWSDGAVYSQPDEHLSEVLLTDADGNPFYRIFFTAGNTVGLTDGVVDRTSISEVFYSDDGGANWKRSENSPLDLTNLQTWAESHVIKITADVTDRSGKVIEAGTLVHYTTYNSSDTMRYSLSYDGGVTWEGDYALPDFPCGLNSFTIEEDPYNRGTYYMATFYNVPRATHSGFPRLRVILLKSTDGYNWTFLGDVDRWGDISQTDACDIMQGVNMAMDIGREYIFIQFGRSEQFLAATHGHNLQLGPLVRLEKSKLQELEWPKEYSIPANTIISIEALPDTTEHTLNSVFSVNNGKLRVNYYDGTYDVVDLAEAIIKAPALTAAGEQKVTVDYKHFRTVYTVNVVAGDDPVISGVADGKTYCGAQTVTVTDTDDDLDSVTLNGTAVTLTDGKFTVSAAEGEQIIIATDKAGNETTITLRVNPDHTWAETLSKDATHHWYECTVDGCDAINGNETHKGGEATCEDEAECSACGKAYGEVDADNHTGEAKWTITADKHSKAYECCGETVVEEAAHTGGSATCEDKAVCSVCNAEYGALAAHKGGTATCTDKAKCEVCGEAYGELNAGKHTKDAKWTITADKHVKAYECCGKVVVDEAAHTGGTATCEDKAVCTVCNAEYGALAAHKGGEATCTDKAKCEVCGEAYGELNADKHTKEAKWTTTADKHSKAYECCGKVVVAEEAHEWKNGKCEECGYEAAPGTEQKPIEIPADKETVKEEAKVEAGEEKHYELDEKMAGMTITIKGEGTYAIIEGKKYEAVNGVLEVKLPAKTGKIPVIIGNAGTKAGTFSITIATPSEDNSDTGDNAAIVLFGSLLALSVLAAGVLLIPDIRKKLIK